MRRGLAPGEEEEKDDEEEKDEAEEEEEEEKARLTLLRGQEMMRGARRGRETRKVTKKR